MEILDGGRISIAALGLGTAIGAYDTALAYAKEREQFGRPIAEFQAIQFALAEMATASPPPRRSPSPPRSRWTGPAGDALSSEAKLYTGEAAVFCSERGVQIHGGYGFVKDYRAEKYYRDAKICTIGEGTSEIQRLVIARQLSRHDGAGAPAAGRRPRGRPRGARRRTARAAAADAGAGDLGGRGRRRPERPS
jgi:acyl-CoA dehydrogenase